MAVLDDEVDFWVLVLVVEFGVLWKEQWREDREDLVLEDLRWLSMHH